MTTRTNAWTMVATSALLAAWGCSAGPAAGGDAGSATDASPTGANDGGVPALESASCATVKQPGQSLVDASGGVWTLAASDSGFVVTENGAPAGYSANVTELVYVDHVVSQRNAAGDWWSWIAGGWVAEADPSGACRGTTDGGAATGAFYVSNGQIVGPDGNAFVARGIDVDQTIPGSQVTALFPGVNFVRMPSGPGTSVSDLEAEVKTFTEVGVVVEIEDHPWPLVAPETGADLQTETSWYASLATAFLKNPYVWFGSMNEPQTSQGAEEATISAQEAAIYAAIRATGNQTIIMMSLMGGGNPGSVGDGFGMTASTYATMTNIVWDLHFYGWAAGYSSDLPTVKMALLGSPSSGTGILAAQSIQSADGLVPVIIGEYGDSTDGQAVDGDASQVVEAVETSGYGSAAWEDSPGTGGADILVSNGALTAYGQTVAAFIAGKK